MPGVHELVKQARARLEAPLWYIGARTRPPGPRAVASEPDWVQAKPARIERALERALAKPAGRWFVLDAHDCAKAGPRRYEVEGRELVVWQGPDGPRVAPAACPHMGADLSCGHVRDGQIVCPWHGLALGERKHGRWSTLRSHDDGVLLWVQLPETVTQLRAAPEPDTPVLPPRPARFFAGVVRQEAVCEPRDIIANRLDPWHGAHFHPHSFAQLEVLEESPEEILLRVAYRIAGKVAMEVDATFHCPSSRCITMTIVGGEGVGSVVETHATPVGPGRTAVVEATLATSDRDGFARMLDRPLAHRVLRHFIEQRAARLWVEDCEYAERTYALRSGRRGEQAAERDGVELLGP